MASESPTWVVLAGGRGARMGGPKPELELEGRRLIDHVIDAIPQDDSVIVVGPDIPIARAVDTCVEEPRFGGPVAALAAALPRIRTARFVLIAADMPWAVPLARTLCALPQDSEVLIPVDADGRRQPLCSVWRTDAARAAIARLAAVDGASMHGLLGFLAVREVPAAEPAGLRDIDTPGDLAAARRGREEQPRQP
jgi:molybdopterin-guanine dinucleotide biosynthesis protein A